MASDDIKATGRYVSSDGLQFWSAEIRGKAVMFQFGKVGTTGQRASREFTSEAAAEEFVNMRLQKKLEEGFRLT